MREKLLFWAANWSEDIPPAPALDSDQYGGEAGDAPAGLPPGGYTPSAQSAGIWARIVAGDGAGNYAWRQIQMRADNSGHDDMLAGLRNPGDGSQTIYSAR